MSEQGQPTKRVFTGRWIIPPEAPFRHVEIEKRVNRSEYASTDLIEEKTVTLYSVAFTQKGNWMVQQWLEHQSPIDGGAVVYASLSDMNSKLPRALVATVADKADGTSEQEWDI